MGGWDIRAAVVRACTASALTVQKTGAQEGIPWADKIDEFAKAAEYADAQAEDNQGNIEMINREPAASS